MEKDIKNKINYNSMKRNIFLMLVVFVVCSSSIFAQDQHELLRYQFEEGTGNIILDTSGNGFHGVRNGGGWTSTEKFGTYAFYFDGLNDYIRTITTESTPDVMAMSMWLDVDVGTGIEVIASIHGDSEAYEVYFDYTDNGYLKVDYKNDSQQWSTLTLIDEAPSTGYDHYIFGINTVTDSFCAWKNTVNFCNTNVSDGIYQDDSLKTLTLGTDVAQVFGYYDGYMDEVRMFDFRPNVSQVEDLYYNNDIDLYVEPIDAPEENGDIVGTEKITIITSSSPDINSSAYSPIEFIATTNIEADCNLYVDSQEIFSIEDTLSFSKLENLEAGEHEYFIYCEYISVINDTNSMKYYDIIDPIAFNVTEPINGLILFSIQGSDFDVRDENLYLATPCMKQGVHIPLVNKKYSHLANPDGVYFQKLTNGQAIFDLTGETHEFCLINGYIEYDKNDYTTNYNPNTVYTQLEIGDFNALNNLTSSYNIVVENFDVYDKTNPKAWGTSWVSIIGSVIAVVVGLILIIGGATAGMPQAVVMGALMVLIALGFQVSNIILGVMM